MNKLIIKLLSAVIAIALIVCGCSAPAAEAKKQSNFTPGTYTAAAKGNGGDVKVEVVVSKDSIDSIKVTEHKETPEYADKAIKSIPEKIIKEQSLGIDAVSGATMTSRAIIGAVSKCVRDAGVNPRELGYEAVGELSSKQEFTIKGLGGKDIIYSGEQVKALPSVVVDTISVNSSGSEKQMKCKGVLLETLLKECGTSQLDYGSVIITATDGYSIEIPAEVLQKRDILIAYEVNGEPCDLRTVVTDERAMYWVKFISQIELMNQAKKVQSEKVIMMETALQACEQSDYKYKENIDKAVMISDLLAKFFTEKSDFAELSSVDEWGKNEKYSLFASQYIKTTGEDAPMFIGPDLPEGMRLKKTLSMKVGKEVMVSVQMAALKLGEKKTGEYSGVSASDLLTALEIKAAPVYIFTGADGYKAEIKNEDLSKGILYANKDGANVRFDGLGKNTSVKGLISIAPKV